METKTNLQDYTRLIITMVFLGLFAFQVIKGGEVNQIVTQQLTQLLVFYFAFDRLGEVASSLLTKRSNGKKAVIPESEVSHVT